MKRIAALMLMALTVSNCVRADVPSMDPKARSENYARRTLANVIQNLIDLDSMVVSDGPDKEKQAAEKAALQTKIDKTIKGLNGDALASFKKLVAEQEISVNAGLKDGKDAAQKETLLKTQKALQMLREKYSMTTTFNTETPSVRPADGSATGVLYAGIALALAFVSGGLMVARRQK